MFYCVEKTFTDLGMRFIKKVESVASATLEPEVFACSRVMPLVNVEEKSMGKEEKPARVNESFDTAEKSIGKEATGVGNPAVESNSKRQAAEDIIEVVDSDEAVQESNSNTNRNCCGKAVSGLCHPTFTHWVTLGFIALSVWTVIYSIAGFGFAPGVPLFNLILLFVLSYISGEVVKLVRLPSLLGMMLMGVLLRNVGFVHLEGSYTEVAAILREFALCVILIRAGLGLDPNALKSLRLVILRLAFVPGAVEGTLTMFVGHFLLGLPWVWGILLGAILAAVSPAVVIPCLFSLQEKGYGTGKGIPTLVVAAATLDDIFAITVFGVVLNVIHSARRSLVMQIIEGPLGILMGVGFGASWGFLTHFVLHKRAGEVVLLRTLMIAAGGLMAVFGSGAIGYKGAGPLGCLTSAFVAGLAWRKQNCSDEHNSVTEVFRVVWLLFQPILFGLIGSEVDVSILEMSTLKYGLISLFCSLTGRIAVTIFISYGAGFNWKEKIFISSAWIPKATVQAALGPLALDIARTKGSDSEIIYAKKILVIAILAILITAPVGTALIATLGPKLLVSAFSEREHSQQRNQQVEVQLPSRSSLGRTKKKLKASSPSVAFSNIQTQTEWATVGEQKSEVEDGQPTICVNVLLGKEGVPKDKTDMYMSK